MKKKTNTGLWIGISILVVILLLGGSLKSVSDSVDGSLRKL